MVGKTQTLVGIVGGDVTKPNYRSILFEGSFGLVEPTQFFTDCLNATHADDYVLQLIIFAKGIAVIGIVKDETAVRFNRGKILLHKLTALGRIITRGNALWVA